MCACFVIGSDISDDGRTASMRFNVILLRNISSFCLQSASRSYSKAYVYTSTCSSAYVYNGCLTWYNVLLIPRITQRGIQSSQLRFMLKSHYIPCLLSLRFFHMYTVSQKKTWCRTFCD